MKKLLILLLTLALLAIPCSCALQEPSWEPDGNGNGWYEPGYPDMIAPEQGEYLGYWDWGTLLPNKPEILIAEGDGWSVYKRGDFKGYSILFPLDSVNIHPPEWLDRVIEVYPDHVVEIIPEGGFPVFNPNFKRILDTRKHEDGTYTTGIAHVGVLHYDQTGKILHFLEDEFNSHEAQILPNGHLLVCTPIDDSAREIDWDGNVYWEWNRTDNILPYDEQNILNLGNDTPFEDPLYLVSEHYGRSSICLNSAQALADGHHLLSFRNADLVVEFDENNEVVWTFGPMILKHQHCATKLENGNVLIHDTLGMRVLEVTPNHEIVWEFDKGMVSTYQGTAQRLSDGSTLITDTYRTVAFCVSERGEVLWEVYVKAEDTLTRTEALEYSGRVLPGFRIYRAWAYPLE